MIKLLADLVVSCFLDEDDPVHKAVLKAAERIDDSRAGAPSDAMNAESEGILAEQRPERPETEWEKI